jgi:hypothetical protein
MGPIPSRSLEARKCWEELSGDLEDGTWRASTRLDKPEGHDSMVQASLDSTYLTSLDSTFQAGLGPMAQGS